MRKYTYQRTGTGAFDIPAADKPEVYDSNGELCTVQNAKNPALAKHAPGPWHNTNYQTHPNFQVLDHSNAFVAEASTEANARLIAAAPELLDALKNLLWQHDNNAGQLCGMALQDARAAISKATGEYGSDELEGR